MNKEVVLKTIKSMLEIKYNYVLSLSEAEINMLYQLDSEQMHHLMTQLYATKSVKRNVIIKSVLYIIGEKNKTIGFNSGKD